MSTHDRTDSIPLAPGEPRCEPSKPCAVRGRCARYQSLIPRNGTLGDWFVSDPMKAGSAMCSGYVDSASQRRAHAPPPPRKHPPIGGDSA